MDFDISEVDLKFLIDEVVLIGVINVVDIEVEVIVDIFDDFGVIEVDEKCIWQILFNLVLNVLCFIDFGGNVMIFVEWMGDMVKLIVKDNGWGILVEDQVLSFDSFMLSDCCGVGLGLLLVKYFV